MSGVSVQEIIATSVISAFTIATGLMWKDVIAGLIQLLVPLSEELFFQLLAASLATVVSVVAIYTILKTEHKAETAVKKIKYKKKGSHSDMFS